MQEKGHVIIVNGDDVYQAEHYQQQIQQFLNSSAKPNQAAQTKPIEVLNWRETNPSLVQAIQSDLVSSSFMYLVLIVLAITAFMKAVDRWMNPRY